MLYLINKNIVFNTEDRTLAMLQDEMSVVVLSNSSNRLLYELLYDYGQTVSRDTLFQNVWDKHGLVSSNSNLNHYISQLRKSLTSFGLNDKVIITVPKVGFRFSDTIPVVLISEEGDSPRAKEDEPSTYSVDREIDKLASEILTKTAGRASSEDEESEQPTISTPEPAVIKVDNGRPQRLSGGSKRFSFLLLASLIFALALGAYYVWKGEVKSKDAILSFKHECHVYTFSQRQASPGSLRKEIELLMKNRDILCADGQFIMMNVNAESSASLCSIMDDRMFYCEKIRS
ncbi:hypothetical protein GLGR_3516 [Leminorella grimontii ATCC 33999 = DSM 5078]|nr:hypothetical protein GLGR_3516 [Leminorella grimontii ATCC 33999 = DSM 5078]